MSNHSVRKIEIQTEQNDLSMSLGWWPEEVGNLPKLWGIYQCFTCVSYSKYYYISCLFVICGLNNLSVSKRIVIYYIINSASLMASVQPSIHTFTHPSIYPYVARYRKKGWLWVQILFSYKSWVWWVIFIRKALLKSISILKRKPQLEESEPGKKRLCEIICFLFSVLFHLAWCSQIHPWCSRWQYFTFLWLSSVPFYIHEVSLSNHH